MTTNPSQPVPDRYSRQVLFTKIGEAGQRKLMDSTVLLVGCGALGSSLADALVRGGVGRVRICDRDFVELNNLQRQVLFDENDIADGLPKAEAARRKLARINSHVTVEAEVVDVNADNIERLAGGCDLLLDGADNFETRYLINDLAVKTKRPWIYGAVIGSTGLCMPVIPEDTPCLRCIFDCPPPPEATPTCDTAGVIAPAVAVVTAMQCVEAFKILTGRLPELNRTLANIDVWTGRVMQVDVSKERQRGNCVCCKQQRFEYLQGRSASGAVSLCGRNAVQIRPAEGTSINLETLAKRLEPIATGPIRLNGFLLKATIDNHELTLFPDARAIIQGTDDPDRAKSIYAKYVGA